ncbi:MAG: phasin family protein [Opitutales bacterium]
MIDLVKKTMMAGVGLAVVTKEKVEESLEELVEKGKISQEEASNLSDKIVEDGKAQAEKAKGELEGIFTAMLQKANLVTKDQYEALEARVTDLEGRLNKEFPNE